MSLQPGLDPEHPQAQELAMALLAQDERNADAWWTLAHCRERLGDFAVALECYWAALRLRGGQAPWLSDLRRTAERAGAPAALETMLRQHVLDNPASVPAAHALASWLRDRGCPDEALDVLRLGAASCPTPAVLHNMAAVVLGEGGRMAEALNEAEAALRIAPGWPAALQNRANIRLALGDRDGALADGAAAIAALAPGSEQAGARLAHALALLGAGRLQEGWPAYGARLDPAYGGTLHFDIPLPRWTPERPLAGLRLLLVGEQGLGDEVMFAGIAPDLERIAGRLGFVVEPRLVPLFARSFPRAEVRGHHTGRQADGLHRQAPGLVPTAYAAFAPMADLLQVLRPSADSFAQTRGYLTASPDRVGHWRRVLGERPGPKVGLLWKSLFLGGSRNRTFAPFDLWAGILGTPGVTFVNLQYGDCEAELAYAREALGVEILQPPGVDLKQDLDEVAALCCALDLTIGFANASTNLAGACGAPLWLITPPEAWTRLGTDRWPWYPQARCFTATVDGWDKVMREVAQALRTEFGDA